MNLRSRFLALASLAMLLGAGAAHAAFDERFDPKKLTIPTLRPIPKVTPQRSTLPNGMVLYLLEDHSLPQVSGTINLRASATWAPGEKAGLGGIMASVMRSGGSASKPGDWMDDRLGAIGADISTSLSNDIANAGFRCLTENSAEVLGLLAEVIRRPAFPDDKLELEKVSARRNIASRNDDLNSLLSRVAAQAIYGKNSPYTRTPEYATVDAITRDDLVAFHELCYTPERAIMVVYGDFKGADVAAHVKKLFGDWKKTGKTPPEMPPMPGASKSRLVFAPKDDVTQSGVLLTQLGFKASDPDYAAMDVYEYALGGGFSSRLFSRIRTERGLAYSAGASNGSGFLRPGIFRAQCLTRNDSVFAALDLLRSTVVETTREPLGDAEAKQARESVENSFVFQFEKPSSVVFRQAFYELAGYPKDFLQQYQHALQEVTPASILAAAQRKVHPDQLVTVIVGKESEFDRKLESAGLPVERVDISIPPPGSKVKAGAASPEALTRGSQWLAKATELAGGSSAWSSIKTFQSSGNLNVSMQGQTIAIEQSLSWQLPDHRVSVQKLPFGEMSAGFDGKVGWRKMMGRVEDDPKAAQNAAEEYQQSLFNLFSNGAKLKVQALPEPKAIDGVSYSVALVQSEEVRDWTLYFAPDGKLARMEFQSEGPKGPGMEAQAYADWKPVGAIQYPHSVTVYMDGEKFVEGKIVSATLNPALDAGMFAKPAN